MFELAFVEVLSTCAASSALPAIMTLITMDESRDVIVIFIFINRTLALPFKTSNLPASYAAAASVVHTFTYAAENRVRG